MRFLSCAAAFAMVILAFGADAATPAKKKTVHKKPAAKSVSTRKKTTTASSKKAPAKRAATWRTRQLAPTPERYKEIQNALVAKGYLQPEEATGSWTGASSDALKKFQAAQKLDSTGKINSLSLIALGLGPKHDASPAKPPASAQPELNW